jgi:hypothetical protein
MSTSRITLITANESKRKSFSPLGWGFYADLRSNAPICNFYALISIGCRFRRLKGKSSPLDFECRILEAQTLKTAAFGW